MSITPRITVKGPLTCGSCGATDFTLKEPTAEVVCPVSYPTQARQPAYSGGQTGQATLDQAALAPCPTMPQQTKTIKLSQDSKDRVFRDQMISTYQADFCGMNEQEIQQHNKENSQNWVDDAMASACPSYKVPKRPKSVSYGCTKHLVKPPKKDKVTPGKSEYQDTYSKTGDSIMHRGSKKRTKKKSC